MSEMSKHALVVDIRGQIQYLSFPRYYRALQRELDRLGPQALADLRDLLKDVEQLGVKRVMTDSRFTFKRKRPGV